MKAQRPKTFGRVFIFGMTAVLAVVMMLAGLNENVAIITVILATVLIPWIASHIQDRRQTARYGKELEDPFFVEVLLDGKVVATLSDRLWTDMFWRQYKITPASQENAALIADDALWEHGKFTFRETVSGMICNTCFPGGSAPFVRDGYVSLRGLYFRPQA